MADSSSYNVAGEVYGSGVASLIGGSGISLDGQSIQLPEDGGLNIDIHDDISSINESSYYRGFSEVPRIKIVGTASDDEQKRKRNAEFDMEKGIATTKDLPSRTFLDNNNTNKNEQPTKEATTVKQGKASVSRVIPLGDIAKKYPNRGHTSKIHIKGSSGGAYDKGGGSICLPRWVHAAPRWLKLVIVFSTAILVGAVVLVAVSLSTALATPSNESGVTPTVSSNANISLNADPTEPVLPVPPPTVPEPFPRETPGPTVSPQFQSDDNGFELEASTEAPQQTNDATEAPSEEPIEEQEQEEKEEETTKEETEMETETSSTTDESAETTEETIEPSLQDDSLVADPNADDAAKEPYDPMVTTFFVTGGRFTNEALEQIPEQLKTLPVRGATAFLVHLGDWNSPYATRCDEQSYQDVNALFSNSAVPVYFVPGDNDYNDCPDPRQAMTYWHQYLLDYESQHWNAPSQWTVSRGSDTGHPENFAFVYNEILLVGINLVGGVVHDSNEWARRQVANLQWIEDSYQQHKSNIRAFVLFAHADPDVPSNSPFYEPFKVRVTQEYNKVPVVLIHRNLGVETWSWETEFENINNFSVIVAAGSVWPPLMGAVDFRQENPFIFDQSRWYDEYIDHKTGG